MKDKFRANIAIVLPAAIIALVLYFVVGLELPAVRPSGEGSFLLTLPYLLVLVAAVAGMNVLGVLTSASSPAVLSGWVQVRSPPGTG